MQRERISLRYKHTRINTLNLGISIQPAYPSTAANLELESETLHEDVQKKLLTKLTALAEEASKKGEKGECHVKELIQFTERYLSSTAFISCYEEMKQIHSLIDKDNIKLNKKRATVKVKLSCDAYILDVLIRVPKHYPDQIVDVDVLTPNPPKSPPSSSSSSASTPSASIPAKRTPSKRDTKQKSKVKTGSSSNFNENNKYNINSDRNSIRDHHNITMMDDKASVIDSGNQTTGHMNMYKKMKGSTNYPPYIIESFRRYVCCPMSDM